MSIESPDPAWNLSLPPHHSRSFGGQITTVLLQPGTFFRTLPALSETRQWVWMAILVLGLVAFSAVRAESLKKEAEPQDAGAVDMSGGDFSGMDMEGGGDMSGVDLGGIPSDAGLPSTSTTPEENDVASRWETGVIAASNVLLIWFALALLLVPVSLINGVAPRLGQNLHIVIWASIPLGLMAGLQLIYYWAGGKVGEPGISGVLPEWEKYNELSKAQQTMIYSGAMRLTLFGLWTCILAYMGAHRALHGKRAIAAACVLAWMALIIIIPVLTGSVKVPEPTTSSAPVVEFETPPTEIIDESSLPPRK
jgi:hypothetical protein